MYFEVVAMWSYFQNVLTHYTYADDFEHSRLHGQYLNSSASWSRCRFLCCLYWFSCWCGRHSFSASSTLSHELYGLQSSNSLFSSSYALIYSCMFVYDKLTFTIVGIYSVIISVMFSLFQWFWQISSKFKLLYQTQSSRTIFI